MTAADAEPGYLGIVPDGAPFENKIAARFAFQIMRDRTGRRAKDITLPILFCICDPDTVAPAGPTRRYAAKARR